MLLPIHDSTILDPVAITRSNLAEIERIHGKTHPAYVKELTRLAFMLIDGEDDEPTTAVLRELLEIERRRNGETHPDYAIALTSFASFLWARGRLDEAETHLREAVEIDLRAFGDHHPKTIQSRAGLDQLRQEIHAVGREQVPTSDSPANLESVSGLSTELEAVRALFHQIAGHLEKTAVRLRSGFPPPGDETPEFQTARKRWDRLIESIRGFDRQSAVECPVTKSSTLEDLESYLPTLAKIETERARTAKVHSEAGRWLDRVEALKCRDAGDFGLLDECFQRARELRIRLVRGSLREPDLEACRLIERSHPLSQLVALASEARTLSDEEWARAFEVVDKEIGSRLAISAARSRVVMANP